MCIFTYLYVFAPEVALHLAQCRSQDCDLPLKKLIQEMVERDAPIDIFSGGVPRNLQGIEQLTNKFLRKFSAAAEENEVQKMRVSNGLFTSVRHFAHQMVQERLRFGMVLVKREGRKILNRADIVAAS